MIAALLAGSYRLTLDHAWIWEGLGIHLTELLCGTRLTWYVRPGEYGVRADPLRERLMEPGADWAFIAADRLRDGKFPPYRETVSCKVEAMSDSHLLAGWTLAAWLIEVRPELVDSILRGLKTPQETPAILEKHLEFPLHELIGRLGRWLPRR